MRPVEVYELIREMAKEEGVASIAILAKLESLEKRLSLQFFSFIVLMAASVTLQAITIFTFLSLIPTA